MTDNSNFNRILKDSHMSMYALARRAGVPYTTVNEIHRGVNDINQCAAGTVWRLANTLCVSSDEILNHIYYLDGVRGRYKGIEYTWVCDDTSHVIFEHEGKTIDLDIGKLYDIPSRIDIYNIFAGWKVEDYIEEKEWQEKINRKLQERAGR